MERSSLGRLAGDKKHGEGPFRRPWQLFKKRGSVLRATKQLSLRREAPEDFLTAPQDRTVVVHVAVLNTERANMNSVVPRKGSRETSIPCGISCLLLGKRLGGKKWRLPDPQLLEDFHSGNSIFFFGWHKTVSGLWVGGTSLK